MVEPVNRWQPVTDEYKTQATAPAEIEAEHQQRLQAIQQSLAKRSSTEKKAPIGIRIFTWYLFCRAGFYALLLFILATFPQSIASGWLAGNLGNVLHMPHSAASEAAARQKEFERQARAAGYAIPDDAEAQQDASDSSTDQARHRVMIFLMFLLGTTCVVAFMWWNRSWKIRWITMFFAGAFVARAALALLVMRAAGIDLQLSPAQTTSLLVSIVLNGLVFCYLAFSPEVSQWFEENN